MLSPVPRSLQGFSLASGTCIRAAPGSIVEGSASVDVAHADRYMSDHGLLLGSAMWLLCGDDKSITSEAGEQKSECVGVEEHLVATDRSRKYPCLGSSMRLLVTDRPYIICHRGEIGLGELGAAHGGITPVCCWGSVRRGRSSG